MEEENTNPFRKPGMVLVTIGLIDIAVMAYCIANKISYSSSFNIFAVIAGVFLLKGGVKTARLVRWFSLFLAVGFIGVLLVTPFTTPISLLSLQFKLNSPYWLGSLLIGVILIGILIWVHKQLSSKQSLKLLESAGYKIGKPTSAYVAGIGIIVLAFGGSYALLNGESALKAKELAQQQLGNGYSYHVSSMSTSGNKGHAVVTAYNKTKLESIEVEW